MKVKQGKKTRKSMAMYTHVFGFRTPYRVLCDGNFLQAALDMKLFVKDLLPKTLLGPCVPVVSKCIRAELSHIGDAVSGRLGRAKRRRVCYEAGAPERILAMGLEPCCTSIV